MILETSTRFISRGAVCFPTSTISTILFESPCLSLPAFHLYVSLTPSCLYTALSLPVPPCLPLCLPCLFLCLFSCSLPPCLSFLLPLTVAVEGSSAFKASGRSTRAPRPLDHFRHAASVAKKPFIYSSALGVSNAQFIESLAMAGRKRHGLFGRPFGGRATWKDGMYDLRHKGTEGAAKTSSHRRSQEHRSRERGDRSSAKSWKAQSRRCRNCLKSAGTIPLQWSKDGTSRVAYAKNNYRITKRAIQRSR